MQLWFLPAASLVRWVGLYDVQNIRVCIMLLYAFPRILKNHCSPEIFISFPIHSKTYTALLGSSVYTEVSCIANDTDR